MIFSQPGRDKHGAAVALFSARLHQPRDSTHQIVLKGLLYQLDAALERYSQICPCSHLVY